MVVWIAREWLGITAECAASLEEEVEEVRCAERSQNSAEFCCESFEDVTSPEAFALDLAMRRDERCVHEREPEDLE